MTQATFKFSNGDKVIDRVTGLTGIVVARIDWYYGCKRYAIQPQEFKDGKPVETSSFDEDQLELVTGDVVTPSTKTTGGPTPDVSRRPEIRR